jgi:alpha-L-fucosidase
VFSVPSWGEPEGGASGEWFEEEWHGANGKPGDPRYAEFVAQRYGPSFTYADFAPMLTMDLFNASQWAELFVQAGAKYTVFLTKHHDGYTLWPSDTSQGWNSVDVGPHRDVAGEISAAVKAVGLHSGLYHSLFEWSVRHPKMRIISRRLGSLTFTILPVLSGTIPFTSRTKRAVSRTRTSCPRRWASSSTW